MSFEIHANLGAALIYVLGAAQGLLIGWALWRRPGLQHKRRERTAMPQESTEAR